MIQFRTLGALDLRRTDGPELDSLLAQPKRIALLAYLCLATPHGFHRRDTILGLFWPDSDEAHARASLRRALHVLRHTLGEDAFRTRGDEEIAPNFDVIWCDAIVFEERLAANKVVEALELYQGEILPGFFLDEVPMFERWLEDQRKRLRSLAARAARQAAENFESDGKFTDAVHWARRGVDLADNDERAVRGLIELLDRAGDRSGALKVYDDFVARLASELQAEPSTETRQLAETLRSVRKTSTTHAQPDNAVTPIVPITPHVGPPAPRPPKSVERRGLFLAIGLAAVLMLLGSSTIYWRTDRASAATETVPSLAVLPFENMGENTDSYFVEGMTDEITSKLGSLAGLTVIGRQSAKRYANTDKPPQQIGKELGATYLLTGTVRWDRSRAGRNLVRITPALVRASNGEQIWSEPYEGEATDVFDMQGKVAADVADALSVNLSRTDRQSLVVRATTSAEAYDYFLRAKNFGSIPGRPTEFLRAVALLERAVQLDPKFALGYAALGRSHLNAYWSLADDNPQRLEWAKAAIDTALAIDPKLAAGYAATATYYARGKFDYRRALDALVVAARLAPNDPDVVNLKGESEMGLNRWPEATRDYERAVALDPRNADFLGNLCSAFRMLRRYADAEKVCDRLIAIAPDRWSGYQLSYGLALSRGDVKGALAIARLAESRVDREEFRSGLLENGGWPAVFDPHFLSEMELARPPADRRALVIHFVLRLYLSVYKGDRTAAREFADSVLVYAPKAMSGVSFFDADVHTSFAMAYAAKGDNRRRLEHTALSLKKMPDSVDGPRALAMVLYLSCSAILAGSYDEGLVQLRQVLARPSHYSVALIRVDPWYDAIRGDPRFKQLLADYEFQMGKVIPRPEVTLGSR